MSHYRFMTEPEGNSETNNHSNKKHFLNHPFFQVPNELKRNDQLISRLVWRHFFGPVVVHLQWMYRTNKIYVWYLSIWLKWQNVWLNGWKLYLIFNLGHSALRTKRERKPKSILNWEKGTFYSIVLRLWK